MALRNSDSKQTTFAFLDIDTAGGNASHDRITEIGICFWRDGEDVAAILSFF
ncbi:hypothetical protein [Marinobacter sp.]|uniref:hypothetical protein n=1 Tax=Marinobacter sp. TaxID=50741 RepID=UPI001B5F20A5|nr:hypothetical protein [Marinobacter sp.]MBQ0832070.1 hypothetical protein [Marinobacter sp.]